MCGGPSDTQKELQTEEAAFYKKQIEAYDKAYQQYSELQDVLRKQFQPILDRGIGQMGYTPEELAALRTQGTEGTATNYAMAQRALQQSLAAKGGAGAGNVNITGGPAQQLQEQLAAMAAGEQSREQLGITTTGYNLGRENWMNAVQGTEALASGWNPNAFSQSAVSAGKSAGDMANTITQQQNSMWGSVLGALGGVAGQVGSAGISKWG